MATPTIAHEGNPRVTDALVVSGTLDGTVTLLIQYPPQTEERPLPPGPESDPAISLHETCGNVFSWLRDGDPISLTNNVGSGDNFITFDIETQITINPSWDCYGFMFRAIPGETTTPEFIRYRSSFLSLVSGNPYCGPCLFASDNG